MPDRELRTHSPAGLRTLAATLFSLAVFALTCVAAELAYRHHERGNLGLPVATWVPDPDLIYKLNPENPNYPQSFRGKAPANPRTAAMRIVCIGGSTTFGHLVRAKEAWPAVIEKTMRADGVDVEVINAGVPAYGVRQNLIRYRRDIKPLKPDVVILHEGWNKTGPLVERGFVPLGVPAPWDGFLKRALIALSHHSLILQNNEQRFAVKDWANIDPYQDVFDSDLLELLRGIQASDSSAALILYPSLYYDGMPEEDKAVMPGKIYAGRPFRLEMLEELDRKYAAIRRVAAETGVPVIDIAEPFNDYHGQDRAALFIDEMHLTVRGNQLMGEIVAAEISKKLPQR